MVYVSDEVKKNNSTFVPKVELYQDKSPNLQSGIGNYSVVISSVWFIHLRTKRLFGKAFRALRILIVDNEFIEIVGYHFCSGSFYTACSIVEIEHCNSYFCGELFAQSVVAEF